ncbi:hypothetical protein ACLQ2N_08400 [Streptomyces sp. DT224]|uniref:hypothetical protein n=1 Tax=Streptomyces sp. DT224 TaxID=3393426 RepID=UPI003CF4D912
MSAELVPYLGAVAVAGAAAVTWAARLAPSRPAPAPAPVFTEPEPGVRWLVCDALKCAHRTVPHRPHPSGGWECSRCEHVTGGGES